MSSLVLPDARAAAAASSRWSLASVFTIAVLGVTAGVQMGDRGLQSVLLADIQASYRVNDATIGALQGLAGILVGSALAVPLARVADRVSRKSVLLALVLAWTLLMALSALAPTFALFFVGRAASGITEFAMIPIVYSLIPDLAPERDRVSANLAFAALMAAGASAGFYFGGDIVAIASAGISVAMEPWRKAFLLLSAAGLPLLALGLAITDPPRGTVPADRGAPVALLPFLVERWRVIGLFVGVAGSLMIAVQALNPLIALALERRFGSNLPAIGQALGTATLVASLSSLPIAGLLDRVLSRRIGLAARPAIMGLGALAAIPCAALLLAADDLDRALWLVALFLFATCISNALVPTLLQDLTPAGLRARSFAVWSFVVSVFCAVGPVIAGALSDVLLGGRLLTAIALTALPALCLAVACAARAAQRMRRGS